MSQVVRTTISCPRCGHTFSAVVEQIIDVGRDSQAKQRFLSGRVNMIACPSCGSTFAVGTPLMYHDPAKKLLIVHVPMQINMSTTERERVIGDLTRRVTDSVPQAQRGAYLLTPKQALTIPGMIDMILDADGITADMREAQRAKMQVVNLFLQSQPDGWAALVDEHDDHIDEEFFQILLATVQNAAETGRPEVSEVLTGLYSFLLQNTTIGQSLLQAIQAQEATLQQVAQELEEMGDDMTREDFMDLVLDSMDDDDRLQALVSLIRPAFDYGFFQALTDQIEAADGDEQADLSQLREKLSQLTTAIDAQTQAVLQRATETLRVILNSQDIDAAIRPRLDQIDDTFLAVLQANIQAAEKAEDMQTLERLQRVLDHILTLIRDSAPPQIKLINEIMSQADDNDAYALIEDRAPEFGPELLDLMDAVADDLEANGQEDTAERLRDFCDFAAEHVGDAPRYSLGRED
jgi:transposase-like protein